MGRIAKLILVILALAACKGETTTAQTQAADPTDQRVAKALFGAAPVGSQQSADAIGSYARGCQAGGVELAETGPTWQAMRLSRNRNWGQPAVIDYIKELSTFAATQPGWEGLYVGDISQPRGGPMLSGHASHQIGLDVDIWMLPPDRLDLTREERENLSSISTRRERGAYTNSNWTPQHEAILRHAASDPRVARIFVFPGAKVAMCNSATGDRSWLNKIRPWWGHHYHFHVRLNCPAGDDSCSNQAPPPPGDGCADAQGWVDRILNPPPPDPNPRPPRGPITMAQLPGQCAGVLTAN